MLRMLSKSSQLSQTLYPQRAFLPPRIPHASVFGHMLIQKYVAVLDFAPAVAYPNIGFDWLFDRLSWISKCPIQAMSSTWIFMQLDWNLAFTLPKFTNWSEDSPTTRPTTRHWWHVQFVVTPLPLLISFTISAEHSFCIPFLDQQAHFLQLPH